LHNNYNSVVAARYFLFCVVAELFIKLPQKI